MLYTADFETTVDINDCRVWAWAVCEIGDPEHIDIGTDIAGFIQYCEDLKGNNRILFHNIKFDGEFIISWLLSNGWRWVDKPVIGDEKVFTTLISDKGLFYSINLTWSYKRRNKHHFTEFQDSYKVIPFAVEQVAKDFDLPISKLEIDYKAQREVGHILTEEERAYISNDVKIMAMALDKLYAEGLTKMTTAGNAMAFYKQSISKGAFRAWYPEPYYDTEVRQAYRGGWTYLKPEYANKDIGRGIVLDVNSLYPSVMYNRPLPYGEPRYFDGEYKPNRLFNIYIQLLRCVFELKPDKLPTVQIKNCSSFIPTEYLRSSNNELVTLCLTSVDLKLFFENYNVYCLEYLGGYEFKSQAGMFKDYIDYWIERKKKATIEGNRAHRTISKIMLNSLYGRFAINPTCYSKYPYLDESGVVHYAVTPPEQRAPIYVPVAAFITAYAREITIRAAQACYDRFVYADTDSLHLLGDELPDGLQIDPVELGAWKHESTFARARFIRAKCYIEDEIQPDGSTELKVTCAGMPHISHKPLPDDEYRIRLKGLNKEVQNGVTWENFKRGQAYIGKLQPTHVKGGIVLTDIDYTIKF